MGRLREVATNLALAAGVTLATLAAVEGGLRWRGTFEVQAIPGCYGFSDNPRLMYELKPHCEDTNSWGMRDREVDPAGTGAGIVALGDSITFGPGVTIDETWPKRLERLTARAGSPATVLNFAVQGYSTVQEVETLRVKALRFRPRIVLLQYFMNDEEVYTTIFDALIDDLRRRNWEGYLDALDLRHGWLTRKILLSRTAIMARMAFDRVRNAAVPTDPKDNVISSYYKERSPVRDGFTALRELAREHDLRVLVLVFPHAWGAFGLPGMEGYPDAWVFDNKRVLGLCRELGMDCVDMAARFADSEVLRALPGDRLFSDGCCHLRAEGHKAMAWVVHQELVARGWLDELRRDHAGLGR